MQNENYFQFIQSHWDELLQQLLEHVYLTLVGLFFSILIGVALGIIMSVYRRLSLPILGFVSILQTIPSIALLGILLPLLGIGAFPAIVALFLYGLLPIVRNTFTGIDKVDPAIVEAAQGMGMTQVQILQQVTLPLALPVIFAGIRTAAVINVGIATLCALIAAGGLGEFIFRGIALNNINMILAGAIPAALLALLMDAVFAVLQRYILAIRKILAMALIVLLMMLVIYQTWPATNGKLTAGFPSEFIEREDGYQGLKEHYKLDLNTREMEISLMYQALMNDRVNVISGFSTDGKIKAYDLRWLKDDKNYFPPYYAAPLATGEVLEQHPQLRQVFAQLANTISNDDMINMNYQVEQFKRDPYEVAKEYLNQQGFSTKINREGSGDLVVGSKNFTESFVLAHLFEIMIENQTSLDVDLKLGFGGTQILFEALANREVQIYPEYTGTGFLTVLKPDKKMREKYIRDADLLYQFIKKEYRQQYNLVWLPPLGFNNTFALLMKEEEAAAMEVDKISDLSSK